MKTEESYSSDEEMIIDTNMVSNKGVFKDLAKGLKKGATMNQQES